jgi:hypothetical protein
MGEVNFPEQTPLYHALHADRYARRDLIERVERITRRKTHSLLHKHFSSSIRN